MWERIREIIRKEFYQVLRHRRMRTAMFLPPIVQLIIFGYAVNLDVENITTAWMDQDHTPASRELLAGFQGSGRFHIVATPSSEAEVQKLLDEGTVKTVIRVLPGLRETSTGAGKPPFRCSLTAPTPIQPR